MPYAAAPYLPPHLPPPLPCSALLQDYNEAVHVLLTVASTEATSLLAATLPPRVGQHLLSTACSLVAAWRYVSRQGSRLAGLTGPSRQH